MPGKIDASDLSAEQRKHLGIKEAKVPNVTKEIIRARAIETLVELTDLKQSERSRVLKQALKLNEV